MAVYIGFSIGVTLLIYFNVFAIFRGYKEIPRGAYKSQLWKYKKEEILEKGVICILFCAIIFSMKYCTEIALVAMIVMGLMLAVECAFARHVRRSFLCPHCGGPIWKGTYVVLIQARKTCPCCGKSLIEETDHDEKQ